jgi:hypothetical protein
MADGTYQKDGDAGFIGLNSRDNPSALPQGYVSEARNVRLDRGVASCRKGLERRTKGLLAGNDIYGSCTYIDSTGQEIIVVVTTDKLWTYNPQTDFLDTAKTFPAGQTITTSDGCDVIQAMDKIFITRGYLKRPLLWDMTSPTLTVFPAVTSGSAGHQFPNPNVLAYYGNRLIAQARHHNDTVDARHRDSVSVSNYLDYQNWDVLDVFTFNNGGNDQVVAIAPWTLNEFIVFMRHSIFYVNIGIGRYTTGDPLSNDSSIKTLVTDMGCIANRSVVQVGGGIMFLSDNGVYFMNPTAVGSNESMRLLTADSPLSAPVDDVIQRINRNYAHRSVGCYWNNRYYLAVPLDTSTKNNAVLIYNFILKAWESVDTYPDGIDVFNFAVAKYNNQRRLFIIDTDQGIFLTEELNHDEYGNATGTPTIPAYLPFLLGENEYESNLIESSVTTRRYTFGTFADKRFSGTEIDFQFQAGSAIETEALIANEDSSVLIDSYGSGSDNDETRRVPIRKFGTGIQLKFTTKSIRPLIRSAFVYGVLKVKNIISKK